MCLFELWFLQSICPVYDSLEWWIGLEGWGQEEKGATEDEIVGWYH